MNNSRSDVPPVDYPALYREMQRFQDSHWWFKVHYQAILDLARPYLKPGMKILDLGSAGGWSTVGFPAGTKRILFDIRPLALGIDRSKVFARICGDAHQIPLKDGSCDLVMCEGLLHQREAEDPRRIVGEAVRVCRAGGVIIVAEPAFSCLFGRHDEVFGGCRRFNSRQLAALFDVSPIRCLRKTYLHLFAFLPLWIVRKTSTRPTTDFSRDNVLTNTVSTWLGTLERKLARRFSLPFGVTVALVMRRNPIIKPEENQLSSFRPEGWHSDQSSPEPG